MKSASGIDGPTTVPEGTSNAVELSAPGSDTLTVVVVGTGENIQVDLDSQGDGSFQLPSSALAGEEIVIYDPKNPSVCGNISVVPATGC